MAVCLLSFKNRKRSVKVWTSLFLDYWGCTAGFLLPPFSDSDNLMTPSLGWDCPHWQIAAGRYFGSVYQQPRLWNTQQESPVLLDALVQDRVVFCCSCWLCVTSAEQAIAVYNFTCKNVGSKAAGYTTGSRVCTQGGMVKKHSHQLLLVNALPVEPDSEHNCCITVALVGLPDKLHHITAYAVGRAVLFLACLDSGC